jgi:hypothetical protein
VRCSGVELTLPARSPLCGCPPAHTQRSIARLYLFCVPSFFCHNLFAAIMCPIPNHELCRTPLNGLPYFVCSNTVAGWITKGQPAPIPTQALKIVATHPFHALLHKEENRLLSEPEGPLLMVRCHRTPLATTGTTLLSSTDPASLLTWIHAFYWFFFSLHRTDHASLLTVQFLFCVC